MDQNDSELSYLWAKEAESRVDAYEQGRLRAVSLEEVMKKYSEASFTTVTGSSPRVK